jgi:protein O-mannosyl-transferase
MARQLKQGDAVTNTRSHAAVYAAIFVVTLLAYWPALRAGFIWDDNGHITPPALQSLHGLARIWTDLGATQQYYPVLHSIFWLEHLIWGEAAAWYHLINIVWHAIAACLLVVVAEKLGTRGAGLAGILFALHPVCVESVAWITEQKNTLSTIFYLAAGFMYLRFTDDRRCGSYHCAFALFVLALATKSVTATLPAALLVVQWWRQGRLAWKADVAPLMPWFALSAAAGVLTVFVERIYIGAQGADFSLTWLERGLLAGQVIWFYVGKIVWPANLSFIYPKWTVDATVWWQYLFPIAALVVIAACTWLARNRAATNLIQGRLVRAPLAVVLLFVGTLFPVLGFLNVYPFKFSYVADHFQYLASLGIFVCIAAGAEWLRGHTSFSCRVAGSAARGVIVVGAGLLTWNQAWIYRTNETVFRAVLARNPDCWLAHLEVGIELDKNSATRGDAMTHYERVLRIRPETPEAHTNLAVGLARIAGRQSDAIAHFKTALRIKPDYPEAHINLANELMQTPENVEQAVRHYREALRIRSDAAVVHYNLANALAKLPTKQPEALHHYEAALRVDPDFLEAHFNLAAELAEIPGRSADAIAHYASALRINPLLFDAHFNIAALYAAAGQANSARQHLEMALKLNPNHATARRQLASLQNNPALP